MKKIPASPSLSYNYNIKISRW